MTSPTEHTSHNGYDVTYVILIISNEHFKSILISIQFENSDSGFVQAMESKTGFNFNRNKNKQVFYAL